MLIRHSLASAQHCLCYNLINECDTYYYIPIDFKLTIDLYPINAIFYSLKVLDKIYNINGLNHKNRLKKRFKMLELHRYDPKIDSKKS